MNANFVRKVCLGLYVALMASGCASTRDTTAHSGFLNDYSKLHQEPAPGGGNRLVYVNPAFTPQSYNAVMLDPIQFYPEPQPTEKVSADTLQQIRSYADMSLRQKVGQRIRLVNEPGPGVAHGAVA
jgi:hypothetical protein